jgi:hypothetical protein
MSVSSIHTAPKMEPQTISEQLIMRIVAALNVHLENLQEEQELITTNSADSHDEMAADDAHWDELDTQIEEVKNILEEMGYLDLDYSDSDSDSDDESE